MARTHRNKHLRWLSDEGDPQRYRTRVREARRELSEDEDIAERLEECAAAEARILVR